MIPQRGYFAAGLQSFEVPRLELTVDLPAAILLLALTVGMALPGCGGSGAGGEAAVESVIGASGEEPGCFVFPRSVDFDPRTGTVCVVDRSGRIQRFAPPEKAPEGSNKNGSREENEAPPSWNLLNFWYVPEYLIGQPTGICFDRDGNLLVADTHYQRVLVFSAETGELLHSWGKKGSGPGEFTQVRDVVQDGSGHLYVADYGGPEDRIEKFDASGRFLLGFGRRGQGLGEFQRPQGLAIARGEKGEETLLVADSCNHRVQRFSLDGRFMASWGTVGKGPGEFKYPFGIAVESRPGGDIFVVEWGNNRVQRFDATGRFRGVLGGPGRGIGELATPWDVAISPDGRIFVADFGNDRVQVFRWPEPVPDPIGSVPASLPHVAESVSGRLSQ